MKTQTQVWKGKYELTLHLLSGRGNLLWLMKRNSELLCRCGSAIALFEKTPFGIPHVTIETEGGKQYYMIANTFGN